MIGEKPQPTEAVFDAMDDLAVGLEHTGHADRAVEVMQRKLAILPPLAVQKVPSTQPTDAWTEADEIAKAAPLSNVEYHHYTAHANLGTAMIHLSVGPAMGGDPAAKTRLSEGLSHIQQAIAINPAAHFGRERWQAIAVQHILTAIDRPEFWTKYSLCGDKLDETLRAIIQDRVEWHDVPAAIDPAGPITPEQRSAIRRAIPLVGIDREWSKAIASPYTSVVPFDEPVLGLIGMWTMGGGPNPYSAIALGSVIERVQQRQIAFNAYERALQMQERMGPTAETRKTLVAFCQKRQKAIAQEHSPADPQAWMDEMRQLHRKELAWGEQYQRDYQQYEAKRIAEGMALDNPKFYEDFFRGRPPVASDPGLADDIYITRTRRRSFRDASPLIAFGAGLGMLVGAMLVDWKRKD